MTVRFDPRPVTLEGRRVRLVPLTLNHAQDLFEEGLHPEIWSYMGRPCFKDLKETQSWIESVQAEVEARRQVAFAIVERGTARAVGSTRYGDIRREHQGLEIGWTWIGLKHQRTAVNTECKLLLLSHAFDSLGAIRVQLKTDSRNVRSQKAIERIGAKREGVLRKHLINWDGYVRDTVCYSIVVDEWPTVKERLQRLRDAPRAE